MAAKYVQYENIVPLIAPTNSTAAEQTTPWVDLKTAHEMAFFLQAGVITSASSEPTVITVEAATSAASTSAAAVGFSYRLSGAVGANSWGDITASGATGYEFAHDGDNKMLMVHLDPAAVQAAKAGATHVRVLITPNADYTVALWSAFAAIDPRYKANTMTSAT